MQPLDPETVELIVTQRLRYVQAQLDAARAQRAKIEAELAELRARTVGLPAQAHGPVEAAQRRPKTPSGRTGKKRPASAQRPYTGGVGAARLRRVRPTV